MWLVRQSNGHLAAFKDKPLRSWFLGHWFWSSASLPYTEDSYFFGILLKQHLFPEIVWESEPRWIRLIRPDWILDKNEYNEEKIGSSI